ncbi:hypothetical protein ACI65C_012078 [Semiaphis heraclei]
MEKVLFYEKLQEYYVTKPKKKPFSQEEQIQMIAEIEAAKTKTYIVSYEDLYDKIKCFHINTGHGGNYVKLVAVRMENQDEAGSMMCNLCRKKEQIKMQRKKGYDGIKKFAEKMLQTSHAAVLDLEVNDCVVMAVPKVDRGPTDPPNIICLLGTKHGMIKGWYGGDCLKKCETFLKSDEIVLDKELSVRETLFKKDPEPFLAMGTRKRAICQRYNFKEWNFQFKYDNLQKSKNLSFIFCVIGRGVANLVFCQGCYWFLLKP